MEETLSVVAGGLAGQPLKYLGSCHGRCNWEGPPSMIDGHLSIAISEQAQDEICAVRAALQTKSAFLGMRDSMLECYLELMIERHRLCLLLEQLPRQTVDNSFASVVDDNSFASVVDEAVVTKDEIHTDTAASEMIASHNAAFDAREVQGSSAEKCVAGHAFAKPNLQRLMQVWSAYVVEVERDRRPRTFRDGATVDWSQEGSENHLKVLREMNNTVDLSRYLEASEGEVDAAVKLARTGATWLAAVQPAHMSKDLIAVPVSQKVWRWAGWTKCGYPILAIDANLWRPSQYSLDTYIRYAMYSFDQTIRCWMGEGIDRIVMILELTFGFESMKPSATRCLLSLTTLFQEVYAGRFAAFFMVNCNSLFHATWRVMKGSIDPKVASLIHFVPPARNKAVLGKFIELAHLEQRFGGDFAESYKPVSGNASDDVPCTQSPAYNASEPDPLRDAVLE